MTTEVQTPPVAASPTPSPLATTESSDARRTGVLLVNLGTPDSTDTRDVRRYLREFLSDPRVIDIHPLGRWLLLNLVILPFRPAKSAHAYRSIWMDEGSPLLVHGRRLRAEVQKRLGDNYTVELAMRYGQPSIAEMLRSLVEDDVERIVIAPLFPQYSSAASGSALKRVMDVAGEMWNVPDISTVSPFYDDEGFIDAFTSVAMPILSKLEPDHVLLSYHGLPERHVMKSDTTGAHCLKVENCCDTIVSANRHCYRAHCFATSRALATTLHLSEGDYTVCFQSRLGRDPWIKPYTDEQLPLLFERGVRRLAIMCPAFVADCLETVEEIGIRAKEDWMALGGESLELIPSLNDHPVWIEALSTMIERTRPNS
ncbi:MAG: ferrochelatase [Myxococcales bacterium]|nr:ferrochelatase [Myxococcales bacterium]